MVHIPCNVGGTERKLRLSLGAVMLGVSALFPMPKPLRWATAAAGTIGLVTGFIDFCPVNQLTGRNTCMAPHHPHE